jgi:hypothetical protein
MNKIAALALGLSACSAVSTVRLQPETVEVGAGMRPIAGVQAEVSTFYFLFIPIPGDVSLDRVVNRMLIVAAKTMGADKVANLTFAEECASMCLSRVFGSRAARASGIAVQLTGPPADGAADDGPEAAPPRK